MSKKIYTGGAKLIIFGEYSALFGYPSLLMRLPFSLRLADTKLQKEALQDQRMHKAVYDSKKYIKKYNVITQQRVSEVFSRSFFNHLRDKTVGILNSLVSEFFSHKDDLSPTDQKSVLNGAYIAAILHDLDSFFCASSIPQRAGFGSSAACSVAIARYVVDCIGDYCREQKDEQSRQISLLFSRDAAEIVIKLAHHYEHYFHGVSSGIDTRSSAEPPKSLSVLYAETNLVGHNRNTHQAKSQSMSESEKILHRPKPMLRITSPGIPIVYCSLFRDEDTKNLIARNVHRYSSEIHELGRLIETFLTNPIDYQNFYNTVDAAHTIQSETQMLLEQEQKFITAIVQEVNTKGKMSGAGGACFFIAENVEHQALIARRCDSIIHRYTSQIPGFVGLDTI